VKFTRLLVLVAFFGVACSVTLATSTDPVMKLGGGGGSQVLTTPTFSFSFTQPTPALSTFFVDFINNTGQNEAALNLLITGSPGLVFSCNNSIDPYFTNCGTTVQNNGNFLVTFFGTDATHLGIPFATLVTCADGSQRLEDAGSTSCTAIPQLSDFGITVDLQGMTSGQSFSVAGTMVAPEPSSLALLLAGALLFLLYRRTAFAL
jgi:hypothetical protein